MDIMENLTTVSTDGGNLPQIGSLNPAAISFIPQISSPSHAGTPAVYSVDPPRFPKNVTRQKSSNVNVTDPEKEFLNTAVNSCRSTIVQQETELKKLRESLDV